MNTEIGERRTDFEILKIIEFYARRRTMITFKKIIEALNTDAPFEYYVVNEEHDRGHLLWLDVLAEADRVYFNSLSEEKKQKYKTESAKIFIPKMTIYKYRNLDEEGGGYDFSYTLNHIKSIYTLKIDDDCLAVAVYMILHELGHWIDLKNKKFNVWEYAYKDSDESKRVFDEQRNFERVAWRYDEKIRKKKAYVLLEKYYNTPIEGRANKYADEHFEEYYTFIINKNLK